MSRVYGKIVQPDGTKYMIQETHYSLDLARDYLNMLIEKMQKYIKLKKQGKEVAPLMTLDQMESQLEIMKRFKIIEEVRDN